MKKEITVEYPEMDDVEWPSYVTIVKKYIDDETGMPVSAKMLYESTGKRTIEWR